MVQYLVDFKLLSNFPTTIISKNTPWCLSLQVFRNNLGLPPKKTFATTPLQLFLGGPTNKTNHPQPLSSPYGMAYLRLRHWRRRRCPDASNCHRSNMVKWGKIMKICGKCRRVTLFLGKMKKLEAKLALPMWRKSDLLLGTEKGSLCCTLHDSRRWWFLTCLGILQAPPRVGTAFP